jgi:hypothetical protein
LFKLLESTGSGCSTVVESVELDVTGAVVFAGGVVVEGAICDGIDSD